MLNTLFAYSKLKDIQPFSSAHLGLAHSCTRLTVKPTVSETKCVPFHFVLDANELHLKPLWDSKRYRIDQIDRSEQKHCNFPKNLIMIFKKN